MSALVKLGLVRIGGREQAEHWPQTGSFSALFSVSPGFETNVIFDTVCITQKENEALTINQSAAPVD
ncbi:unnamed protein product [Tetraodon nigroviridis]|uniref:Chromosome 16 SCAF15002, whole genome shotgun sequence n=1 Tax=Tetraodon nigroviridis TaxID=99883 RepID=Q4RRC4_TETNG|nr:unnamed protein product [Tetraodon nigroviridis]